MVRVQHWCWCIEAWKGDVGQSWGQMAGERVSGQAVQEANDEQAWRGRGRRAGTWHAGKKRMADGMQWERLSCLLHHTEVWVVNARWNASKLRDCNGPLTPDAINTRLITSRSAYVATDP